jgi:predicted nucleic acid-binding protein
VAALEVNVVGMHPFVTGELACGQLKSQDQVLSLLRSLPRLPAATDEETLYFIGHHRLMGRGLGYIDVHLLAATAPRGGDSRLWTRDKRLETVAVELGLGYLDPGGNAFPSAQMCKPRHEGGVCVP